MKTTRPHRSLLAALAALALAASAGTGQAAELMISTFDDSGATAGWYYQNWNGSTAAIGWGAGPDFDAGASAGSGSLKLSIDFDNVGKMGGAFRFTSCQDISTFTALEYDVKVDPASSLDSFGNVADVKVGFMDNGWMFHATDLNIAPVAANEGWQHVVIPLSSISGPGTQPIQEMVVQVYDGNYISAQTAIFYIDNIKFTAANVQLKGSSYNLLGSQFSSSETVSSYSASFSPATGDRVHTWNVDNQNLDNIFSAYSAGSWTPDLLLPLGKAFLLLAQW